MSAASDARSMVLSSPFPPAWPATAGPPGAGAAGAGIGAADAWRIIKQRKLLIAVTFCVAYLVVVAATLVIWRFAPAYSSEALIRYIPPPTDALKLGSPIVPKDYVQQQLLTESARIRSIDTLLDLLAQETIKKTSFYQWYGGDHMKCLYDLQDMLGVAPVRDSMLIRVQLAARKPAEATLFVNTLVERYVFTAREQATEQRRQQIDMLLSTRANVQEQLDKTRRSLSDLRAQRNMLRLEGERDVLVDVIAMLNNTKSELLARLTDAESQMATINGMDYRNLPLSAEMKVIIEGDPSLRFLRQSVEQLDIQIAALEKSMLGKEHKQMHLLRDQREEYFQKEAQRREELIDDLRARQVESLQQERARIRNMLTEVQEQLSEREKAHRDLDSALQLFKSLEKDEERLGKELEQVGTKVHEAEYQHEVQKKQGSLERASEARDAIWPSRPNFVIYLGGGFLLALLAAIGLAFLREFTDQAVRTPIDVARYGHLSVLGCVPLLDDEEADLEEVELATRRASHSLVAEAFRQIRAHLTFSGPLESQRTLLITSPRPEDGKTATAINLAVTFAQGNQRVLLIDCNFRRPGVRRAFAKARADGLSNILVGQAKFEDLVNKTELANLDVLTSGPMPPNPAELLGSPLMRELLETVKQKYDRVLLDGPPCLLISDALLVATQVDAVVMVARAANSSKGALRRAREQLARINARVVGAVLNGVEARPGGYFRSQYREFYEYTNEEVVPRELAEGPPEIDVGELPDTGPKDPDET